jgi:hypothetical protein
MADDIIGRLSPEKNSFFARLSGADLKQMRHRE